MITSDGHHASDTITCILISGHLPNTVFSKFPECKFPEKRAFSRSTQFTHRLPNQNRKSNWLIISVLKNQKSAKIDKYVDTWQILCRDLLEYSGTRVVGKYYK